MYTEKSAPGRPAALLLITVFAIVEVE